MNAKNLRFFISFVFLGTGALIVMSLSSFKKTGNSSISLIKEQVQADLNQFERSLQAFVKLSQTNDRSLIHTTYAEELRPALKKVEWILAYFDPEAYTKWINGAPLPKVEKNAPNPKIFEPNGFQTIDEWMAESDVADLNELRELSAELQSKAKNVIQLIRTLPWHERHFFEAARAQVLRIYTLGVTGFDTPGTLLALKDAEQSLRSLKVWLKAYEAEMLEETAGRMHVVCLRAIETGLSLLKGQDFDTFDRVSFYKQSIQPLYAGIRDFQLALGVETRAEIDNSTPAINPEAIHLFSDNFFNKDFYAELPPSKNSKERAALGKLLFFDPILSFNAQRSCASCHQPAFAYSENRPKSLANEQGQTINRNAPGLINAVYAQDFFYDLRSGRLQDQIEHVVFSHDEFNLRYDSIVRRLKSSPEYVNKFKEAFPELGDQALDQYSINVAIASYVAGLSDYNSPFDRFMRSESELEADAIAGFNLFMGKAVCATCHFPPSFAGLVPPEFHENETEVLGITTNANFDKAEADLDPGRFASGKPADKQSFYQQSMKTTTVRNAELTPPYMHNGSLQNLEDLIEFYDRGGGAGMGLDVPHQTLGADPLELSDKEKRQLISFIKSLSNNPFRHQMVERLPEINHPDYRNRVPGGLY